MVTTQSESLVTRIVEKSIQALVDDFSINLESAFEFIYKSHVFEILNNPESDLRSKSFDYVYELIKREYLSKS
ncbi:MAG: hypothetical protein IIU83_07320 [Fibrobacteraceae bacterium]|jgi:hypothetical protein|nr:hypothetical protein [Fibrobacteraceae bacterium]